MTYSAIKRKVLLRLLDRVCEALTKADCTRAELREGDLGPAEYSPKYVFQHGAHRIGGRWSGFVVDRFHVHQGVDSAIMTLRMIREITRRVL